MSSYGDFAYVYDALTDDISYQHRAAYFDQIIHCYIEQKGILLDLACGTGSLSEEFAQLGYDVIGVDGSEDMLTVAMDKKAQSGQDITYLCQNMENLDLYGTIDVVICALDSLNHIVDMDQLQQAINRVSLFLDPNGLFIFDVNTCYKHREVLGNNTFVYDYDEIYLVWKNSLQQDDIVKIELDIFEKDNDVYDRSSESFCERAYSTEQLEDILHTAGLQVEAVYHEDSFDPPRQTSERVVYVAKKMK